MEQSIRNEIPGTPADYFVTRRYANAQPASEASIKVS